MGDKDKKKDKDQLTYFEPPEGCNWMEAAAVPEIGVEFVRNCLIPRKDAKNITALDNCGGQLMTFMFNVEARDRVKCYLIWNGQTMRFHGEHLVQVLPEIFNKSKANEA